MESNIKKEFFSIKSDLLKLKEDEIINWFIKFGFYGDKYKYPPMFLVTEYELPNKFVASLKKSTVYELLNLKINSNNSNSRIFSLIHPNIYCEVVKLIAKNWAFIIDNIFNDDLKIFSFSFPLPVDKEKVNIKNDISGRKKVNIKNNTSNRRRINIKNDTSAGTMVYNFLALEENIISDSHNYKYILRADISKCYHSIYTHSIAWALHGKLEAREDKENLTLLGNKLDKYFQLANGGQTNGIPIGSAISDVVAEIVLSSIDKEISKDSKINSMDFIAARYKDDYRFLCNSEKDAIYIRNILEEKLREYNLFINIEKTSIMKLPQGLERKWKKLYDKNCNLPKKFLKYKSFINAYFYLIEIENTVPGSSMILKFLDSLVDIRGNLIFSNLKPKEIIKVINLLSLLIDYLPRVLAQVLAIIELFIKDISKESEVYKFVVLFIEKTYLDIVDSSNIDEYKLIWIYFFAKKHNINLNCENPNFKRILSENRFLQCLENEKCIFDNISWKINLINRKYKKDLIYNHISLYHKTHHNTEEEEYNTNLM